MGRIVISPRDSFRVYNCSNCRCGVVEKDHIIIDKIETQYGPGIGVKSLLNVTSFKTNRVGQFNTCATVTIFDDDSILEQGGIQVYDIHCINCMLLLGWNVEHIFIILKDTIL